MDNNTKSLLKNTIMGLVSGGALSALYTLHKHYKDEKADKDDAKDDIVVPLSKKNYMKALGKKDSVKAPAKQPNASTDVSAMSSKDLAALKKELLRKSAEPMPTQIKEKNGPASSVSAVRKAKTANYATIRNNKGQYSTEKNLAKSAGISDDAKGTVLDVAGSVGGFMAGMSAVKYIADRIMVNRKKKQLEKSRKTYVDMLNREVNDEDTPYYHKAAEERGTIGRMLGLGAVAGLGTVGAAGLVVYRIMENRRKEEEKKMDEDLSRFPLDKTIKYKFANAKENKGTPSFFA